MPEDDRRVREVVAALADALQVAAPLADALVLTARVQAEDAEALRAAVGRGVDALRALSTDNQIGGGR